MVNYVSSGSLLVPATILTREQPGTFPTTLFLHASHELSNS